MTRMPLKCSSTPPDQGRAFRARAGPV
jgi:hypothetical protein